MPSEAYRRRAVRERHRSFTRRDAIGKEFHENDVRLRALSLVYWDSQGRRPVLSFCRKEGLKKKESLASVTKSERIQTDF